MLASFLGQHGWIVHAGHNGQRALELCRSKPFEVILLDIDLSDCSGFDLIREIHDSMGTPIIVISGRCEETDRIVGLELGADDYISKPFSLRELFARMGAVVRRSGQLARSPNGPSTHSFGHFVVQLETHEISYGRTKLTLTPAEFQLLRLLLDRPYEVCSRELLAQIVLLRTYDPLDRSLDMHILRLRRKLGRVPQFGGGILTVRSGGYMLALHPQKFKGI